jgi:predicted Ser/Thr protein kinase
VRKLGRLGTALGPTVILWLVVPVLLARAVPDAAVVALAAIGAAGAAAQLGSRLVSNRGWFVGDRSPTTLVLVAVAVGLASAAALVAVAVASHQIADDGDDIDTMLVLAVAAVMAVLVASGFWGRVEFRGWLLYHRDVRARVRPYASAPIGPDRAVVHDLLDDLSRDEFDETSRARLAGQLPLVSDDRFRRVIPWSSARPLLDSFVGRLAGPVQPSVAFADDGRDDCRVQLGPICDLVAELAADPTVVSIDVETSASAAGLVIAVTTAIESGRGDQLRVDPVTARGLATLAARVARPAPDTVAIVVDFVDDVAAIDTDAVDAFLAERSELLAESPYSAGARRVYRRGANVVKTQRHDVSDPKPTLLEDEFHLLRRLQGRSDRSPKAAGYGIEASFSWIAYRYVDGQPLDSWLDHNPDDARRQLLSFGVDVHEMLETLAACRVAHRDLNPGNIIRRPDGGLVLIDFDQGASGAELVGVDRLGVDEGLAKNDMAEFLDRAGLTRLANELLAALDEAWSDDLPFSLGMLGHRFGDGWRLDPLLDAARERLAPLSTRRVLDRTGSAPVLGLLLASAGAEVAAVVDDPARWERLGRLVGAGFTVIPEVGGASGPFDLIVDLGRSAPLDTDDRVLRLSAGAPGVALLQDPWTLTTALTQIGT